MDVDINSLHPLEVKVLLNVEPGEECTIEEITLKLSFKAGQCNQAFSWLLSKGLIEETKRTAKIFYELTELGREYRERGTPAERMLTFLREKGPQKLPDLAACLSIENKDAGSAFGQMARDGMAAMDEEKRVVILNGNTTGTIAVTRALLEKASEAGAVEGSLLAAEEKEVIAAMSKKRGAGKAAFRITEREVVVYRLTSAGETVKKQIVNQGITEEEIGLLTPEMLAGGRWKGKKFREYNINTPPVRVLLGRRNPYGEFLEGIKDKLVSLGFEEFDGPLVETAFWNSDALFMPQFHSARDIHDVYYVKTPRYARKIQQPYLDQVAATHENGWETGSKGWNYPFDRDFTKRLILRSQGTVLSAKTLTRARVPGKYFGTVRCFRYDKVDATHLSDFYQTEGIVLGEDVNLKTLLGLLKMFAEELAGAEDVKYVPGYFPFTEPSVEVHIKHPVLGWFELGGSGIFRPEVTQPLGINVQVLAWGLGIDRMALMSLGLNDLRELFTQDIESVRLRRRK
ncbi:MAG: phenylalanine--tRNA ligase subunit alpha [Spirochaetota bacterium]